MGKLPFFLCFPLSLCLVWEEVERIRKSQPVSPVRLMMMTLKSLLLEHMIAGESFQLHTKRSTTKEESRSFAITARPPAAQQLCPDMRTAEFFVFRQSRGEKGDRRRVPGVEEHRNHLISELVHWLMTRHVPPERERERVTAGRTGRRIMDIGKG